MEKTTAERSQSANRRRVAAAETDGQAVTLVIHPFPQLGIEASRTPGTLSTVDGVLTFRADA